MVVIAVKGIEANMPNTPGATKKDMVMAVITAACKVGESIPDPVISGIAALIDSVVGVFNKSGIFTHSTTKPVTQGS